MLGRSHKEQMAGVVSLGVTLNTLNIFRFSSDLFLEFFLKMFQQQLMLGRSHKEQMADVVSLGVTLNTTAWQSAAGWVGLEWADGGNGNGWKAHLLLAWTKVHLHHCPHHHHLKMTPNCNNRPPGVLGSNGLVVALCCNGNSGGLEAHLLLTWAHCRI